MQCISEIKQQDYSDFGSYINSNNYDKVFIVCGKSLQKLPIGKYLENLIKTTNLKCEKFMDYKSNPDVSSVILGYKRLTKFIANDENKDNILLLAIGGGSAIDVAKGINIIFSYNGKTLCNAEDGVIEQFLFHDLKIKKEYEAAYKKNLTFYAIPTTAGSGAESTHFAVIYKNGVKNSIAHNLCLPNKVFLDGSSIEYLSDYQRKVTYLDALCHATECFWSVAANDKSKELSIKAITILLDNLDCYLNKEKTSMHKILYAANLAGQAINIAKTNICHAMSYKLTSMYNIAHGHAVALCMSLIFPLIYNNYRTYFSNNSHLINQLEQLFDCFIFFDKNNHLKNSNIHICSSDAYNGNNSAYLISSNYDMKNNINIDMNIDIEKLAVTHNSGNSFWSNLIDKFQLDIPKAKEEDYKVLTDSVNIERLMNFPIKVTKEQIELLYKFILKVR